MIERFEEFTVLIANLTRSIRRIKTEEMGKWNLKNCHVSCIYYLYERESLTSKELCDICGDDKANISRSIEYLEENGYLKCRESSGKRYKTHFELTEKGRSVGGNIYNRIKEILDKSSAGLSEEDRETMYMGLRLVNNNLQKISSEYKN